MSPATPKKKRGCLFWTLILVVLFAVISCIVATPATTPAQQPPATATTSQSASVAVVATEVPPTPTAAPTIAVDPNQGITFGEPVTFAGAMPMAAVLATNTTTQVKSFTVKATYKQGDQLLATASGAVNELLPNQTRAVMLLAQGEIPTTADTIRVDVDTMVLERDASGEGDVAQKIAFGQPLIQNSGSFAMVDVEVTNNDTNAHSFTVQAIFLRDNQLVGLATGAVNELAPGQTKTASLITQGETDGATVQLAIETIVQ